MVAVSLQPASSSVGPEQTLGEVLDEDEDAALTGLGSDAELDELVPLEPLEPLEPLDPLDPLLACATLTVVIAGAAYAARARAPIRPRALRREKRLSFGSLISLFLFARRWSPSVPVRGLLPHHVPLDCGRKMALASHQRFNRAI